VFLKQNQTTSKPNRLAHIGSPQVIQRALANPKAKHPIAVDSAMLFLSFFIKLVKKAV
jgi:hypothetical protein